MGRSGRRAGRSSSGMANAANKFGQRIEVQSRSAYILGGDFDVSDALLDAKGLKCPLPILKARKALKSISAGSTLRVLTTDPGSVADFAAFCRATGNELLESNDEGQSFNFLIRRGS